MSSRKFKLRNPQGFKFEYKRFDPMKPKTPEQSDMGYSYDDRYKIDLERALGIEKSGPSSRSSFYYASEEEKEDQPSKKPPANQTKQEKQVKVQVQVGEAINFVSKDRQAELEYLSSLSLR